MRGTGAGETDLRCRARVIPACAGNSPASSRASSWPTCHPCVCGEQAWWPQALFYGFVSSLRVRGTALLPPDGPSGDPCHPCVCGEQQRSRCPGTITDVSSLRVRGTARYWRHPGRVSRVIPACAGNSSRQVVAISGVSCHPCVCGEQGSRDTVLRGLVVSSLRVRGTELGLGHHRHPARVIPACAGNRMYERGAS